jgi:hypothetical protein
MEVAEVAARAETVSVLERPKLIFFHSRLCGRARRVEGFLANVLQRRQNHDTFHVRRVAVEDRPDLAQRLDVGGAPTLVVVEGKHVRSRLEDPRGTQDIQEFLRPWLKPGRPPAA